jgi:hypothetical protein
MERNGAMPVPPPMKRKLFSRVFAGKVNEPSGPLTARCAAPDRREFIAPQASLVVLDEEFQDAVGRRVFRR